MADSSFVSGSPVYETINREAMQRGVGDDCQLFYDKVCPFVARVLIAALRILFTDNDAELFV